MSGLANSHMELLDSQSVTRDEKQPFFLLNTHTYTHTHAHAHAHTHTHTYTHTHIHAHAHTICYKDMKEVRVNLSSESFKKK